MGIKSSPEVVRDMKKTLQNTVQVNPGHTAECQRGDAFERQLE